MVAKISVGSSLFGALSYNQNKVNEQQGKVLLSNRMFESEDGIFSIRRCMECFDMHLPADLKTEKPIIHISLNPHPDDVLSDNQLADIAKEYMDKLGYGNQPYMVYKHEDIARHHIHIVSIRVDETGKKINDKFEHIRSKQITRELEQKYGLHPAEKKQAADRPELKKVDYRTGDVKHQLSNTVKALASSYRFQSFTEYKALLSIYNVQAEEVKGEVNGKPYNGIVYSATNDKGEKQGNPFKSSSLGKSVGYEAIQRHIKKSAKDIQDKNLKECTRRTVGAVMKSAHNRKELEQELKKKGIDVLSRQNDTGGIYGVTFIDHENRTVLNGSRLGKDFSANVFKIAYNHLLGHLDGYKVKPKFYMINFDDPRKSHRCNPINPAFMTDISDAYEASYTIMLNLNRSWITKQGDFFVESPIILLASIIWFLKIYQGGKYCTFPHAIEFLNKKYSDTFTILTSYPELENYLSPFMDAWESNAQDQLQVRP